MPGLGATPLRELDGRIEHGCRMLSTTSVEYLDGAEQRLYDIVNATADLRSTSDALVVQARSWPEHYHLSPARANVLRPLDLRPDTKVLEVGAGCGAITRYLGERCAVVDAVEPMLERAKVARARTRDLPGVEIFVGDIFDVPPGEVYDAVVVVGVLEYTGAGSTDPAPYQDFLSRARSLLSKDGTLVVAIENRIGVKYQAGAPEDHTSRPFDSLEGYLQGTPARTFARNELEVLFHGAGLVPDVLGAFPDYKLTRMLFSDRLLDADASLAYRIPQFPSPDWGVAVDRVADEARVWRTMVEAGLGGQTANSLVVLGRRAGAEGSGLWPRSLLAAYYAVGRRAPFGSETRVVVEGGSIVFDRHPLWTESPAEGDGEEGAREHRVQLRLGKTPWANGTDLLALLSEADDAQLADWIGRWNKLLMAAVVDGEPVPIDLLPHNLVVLPDGSLSAVDSKFAQVGVSNEALVARGALITGQRLSQVTNPHRWGAFTVEGIVRHLGTLAGLPPDGSWIAGAVAWEAAFQAQVSVLAPDPPTQGEAVAYFEADLWAMLHRPLVEARQRASGVQSLAAVDAELGRMGDAYRTLVDSHYSLAEAHRVLIEQHSVETAEVGQQLDRERTEREEARAEASRMSTELAQIRRELDSSRSEIRALQGSTSWKLTRPIRAVASFVRRPAG